MVMKGRVFGQIRGCFHETIVKKRYHLNVVQVRGLTPPSCGQKRGDLFYTLYATVPSTSSSSNRSPLRKLDVTKNTSSRTASAGGSPPKLWTKAGIVLHPLVPRWRQRQ